MDKTGFRIMSIRSKSSILLIIIKVESWGCPLEPLFTSHGGGRLPCDFPFHADVMNGYAVKNTVCYDQKPAMARSSEPPFWTTNDLSEDLRGVTM